MPKAEVALSEQQQQCLLGLEAFIAELRQLRAKQPESSPLRKVTIVEHTLELDVYQE